MTSNTVAHSAREVRRAQQLEAACSQLEAEKASAEAAQAEQARALSHVEGAVTQAQDQLGRLRAERPERRGEGDRGCVTNLLRLRYFVFVGCASEFEGVLRSASYL